MRKLLPILLLLLPSLCFAQGGSVNGGAITVLGPSGRPLAGATVTICAGGATGIPCSPTITVYTDATLSTPTTNPQTSDGNGNVFVYAAPGTYTYTVTGTGIKGKAYTATVAGSGGGNVLSGSANTFTATNNFNGATNLNAGGVLAGTFSGARTDTGNNTHSGTETFTGAMNANNGGALNGTFTGPTTLPGVSSQNKVIFADQQAGATADVKINNAVAALGSAGGFIDARGFGNTVQTIAATVTIGNASKTAVTLFFDRSTTFNCTITNNTPCIVVQGVGTMMGFGTQANGVTGLTLAATASVSDALLIQGNQSTNQVGSFVEGLTVSAPSGAVASDALCAVQNTLQLTKLLNVACVNAATAVPIALKIYATGGTNGLTNPFFDNVQADCQNTAGCRPVWIGCTASGNITGASCSGSIQSVNFFGGLGVHPGSGLPCVTVEATNGAAGTNVIQNVSFFGYQLEVGHAGDIGILDDGAASVNIHGLFASSTVASGADVVRVAQPAGTVLDGVNATGVINGGSYTNTFNNTQISSTVTGGQCSNGCNYRYTKAGSGAVRNAVWDDAGGNVAILDSNGVTVGSGGSGGNSHSLRFTEQTAPSAAGAGFENCYGDSTLHTLKCSYNNGTFFQVPQVITATSAAFATATTAGTCVQNTTAVTGAATSMAVSISPVSTPGVGAVWSAFVSSAGNVTINECAVATSAGGSIAFNIRVTP